MKVFVAEKYGFCPGVKNAITLAKKTLQEHEKVYSLGPIIHNEEIVNELSEEGLETTSSVDDIDKGTVLIRSHGATLKQLDQMRSRELNIVDATCVLVKRVQKIAQKLDEEGYKVVVIGDEHHPEVQAVVGSANNVVVLGGQDDLCKLSGYGKLGIICQTTQSPDYFTEMLGKIIEHGFSELKVVNTLCSETKRRQDAAVKLCKRVDIMFVLGGHHSANTRKLAELCKNHNNQTFHLQNWRELDKRLLCGIDKAGVTAGASTPDKVIDEFVAKLNEYSSQQ